MLANYTHSKPTLLVPLLFLLGFVGCNHSETSNSTAGIGPKTVKLLNVSYDPTREFYLDFNKSFVQHWREKTGNSVEIDQSHGGSGKQARAVNEGLKADIVSLALAGDIDTIAKQSGLIDSDWQSQFPNNSSPYTSTIVFLVRKGNPKKIKDWSDLVRDGVEVITPNPKTGGGARWNYLAAWGATLHRELGDLASLKDPNKKIEVEAAMEKAKAFIGELYRHVPVLDTSARAATNTFIQRSIGDVLLTWENEAFLAFKELGTDQVELVIPPISILAEPPVAVVTKNAQAKGTTEVATAYLEYLYTPEGQRLAAKHYYRPRNGELLSDDQREVFAKLTLFQLTDVVAGWDEAHDVHFKDRTGVFDQIYQADHK
jgi:sulfate/thiosulfate transport system substrate-binding protein